MARTKKVGITGRFGARYGRKAKNMLNNGFSIEDISICTNLTPEQINNL